MAVATQAPPWSHVILHQLAKLDVPDSAQWAVVHVPDGDAHPYVVEEGLSATETGAVIVAEDFAQTCGGGEVVTVKLADLQAAAEAQAEFENKPLPDPTRPSFLDNTAAEEPGTLDAGLEREIQESDEAELEAHPLVVEVVEVGFEHEPDALEQEMSKDGVEVRISGPDGTTGAAAIERAVAQVAVAEPDPPVVIEEEGALFDAAPFLQAVQIDGHNADALKIAFGGSVALNERTQDDRELFESLKLGKPVTFTVHGHVVRKVGGWKETDEGERTVTGTAAVKVDSLTIDAD